MTPKEKAEELVNKFKEFVNGYVGSSMLTNTEYYEIILLNAKQCALISVNEIIKQENTIVPKLMEVIRLLYINKNMDYKYKNDINIFWQEVKKEIEKL